MEKKNKKRHVCTKDNPWTPEKNDRAEHPSAILDGDGDDFERYRCPHCGHTWKEELAQ